MPGAEGSGLKGRSPLRGLEQQPVGLCSFSGGLQPGALVLNAEVHELGERISENVANLLEGSLR